MEVLEERPPDPQPRGAFALPTPGEIRIPCLIFTPPGVEKQLKIFANTFSSPLPHAFITLFHPTSQSSVSRSPPKQNVAVPINKVEVRLGGANPVRGGVGVAHHPMRGVRKVFSAEGVHERGGT